MFESVGSPLTWGAFLVGILFLLAIDLGLFNRKPHRVSMREALMWSCIWVLLSLAFNGWVWHAYGSEKALEFLSAYLIEKALSVDNIFVFIVLFRYMRVQQEYMHRILFAGILGALILRGIFIVAGLALIEMFTWSLYLFGGFLVFTGLRLLFVREGGEDEEGQDNWVKRWAERYFRVTKEFQGPRFFVTRDGKRYVTTLFVTLLMVETADVVFALDSIPAIFGISTDPFIVFTSNVCAVMGLRAMFFLLENVIDRFWLLKYGLGLVLSFVGVKMLLGVGYPPYLEPFHIPVGVSLATVSVLIGGAITLSLLFPPSHPAEPNK
ncbi:tellurite resistance protein TerC [Nannocystis exedens]|uniref:Tellurite resistance protein TerC n=1 Tax=Nannocystis exedens TaxID=54 RepID=A0A1I1WD68_9BACT|nr:TerC family protein [Nannocystis exedens]PCC67632.1 membrane protein [Nannocystis exedens]SFD93084.1 tellurite resistance protein TerC [Nannocystis exedens]